MMVWQITVFTVYLKKSYKEPSMNNVRITLTLLQGKKYEVDFFEHVFSTLKISFVF